MKYPLSFLIGLSVGAIATAAFKRLYEEEDMGTSEQLLEQIDQQIRKLEALTEEKTATTLYLT